MDYRSFQQCGLKKFLDILSGKWKPLILFHLFHEGDHRFTDMWRKIPRVSKKVLLEQIRDLEQSGIVLRRQENTFPPEVWYGLSDKGKSLGPILHEMENWSKINP